MELESGVEREDKLIDGEDWKKIKKKIDVEIVREDEIERWKEEKK